MRNFPHELRVIGQGTVHDEDGIPVWDEPSEYTTQGMFSILDVEEAQLWEGQQVTASVRVPLGVDPVGPGDRVVVMGHSWRVVTTRENPMHLRVMLRRSE